MSAYTFAFLILLTTISKFNPISSAPTVTSQNGQNTSLSSITEDYKALRTDVQWFFQHVELFADSLVQILPATNKEGRSLQATANNSTFVENTRLTLLLGLRHMLVGIKEISVAFQRRLAGDHELQMQQIKTFVQLLQDIIRFAKHWFSVLRNSLSDLFRIYNHYIPEVLLGKCFGKYITTAYPDRSFYEYPFILVGEVVDFGIAYMQSLQIYEAVNESPQTKSTLEVEDISDEQNEIWRNEIDNYARSLELAVDHKGVQEKLHSSSHPWQKCLKLYAADSISRQLKLFFIGD